MDKDLADAIWELKPLIQRSAGKGLPLGIKWKIKELLQGTCRLNGTCSAHPGTTYTLYVRKEDLLDWFDRIDSPKGGAEQIFVGV